MDHRRVSNTDAFFPLADLRLGTPSVMPALRSATSATSPCTKSTWSYPDGPSTFCRTSATTGVRGLSSSHPRSVGSDQARGKVWKTGVGLGLEDGRGAESLEDGQGGGLGRRAWVVGLEDGRGWWAWKTGVGSGWAVGMDRPRPLADAGPRPPSRPRPRLPTRPPSRPRTHLPTHPPSRPRTGLPTRPPSRPRARACPPACPDPTFQFWPIRRDLRHTRTASPTWTA